METDSTRLQFQLHEATKVSILLPSPTRPNAGQGDRLSQVIIHRKTSLAWAVCFPIVSGEFLFYPSENYSFIYMRVFKNLKARILKSIIT